MMSPERIKELQLILEEDFGESVSFEQASAIGANFLRYFDLLIQLDNQDNDDEKLNQIISD